MRNMLFILAWVMVCGGLQAQPESPLELIRPEDAVRVEKYYEAQFGAERRDEMIRHVATNSNLRALLEALDVELRLLRSQKVIREKMSSEANALIGKSSERHPLERDYLLKHSDTIKAATRFFYAYAGEDYHVALPAIIAKRNSEDYYHMLREKLSVTASEKQMILEGARRGGLSTGYVHAMWMLDGTEVVKDETRGWDLLAKCADHSTIAAHQYANALLKKKSNKEKYELALPIYRKIAVDSPQCSYAGSCLYAAMNCAKELELHLDYLTLGYVNMARFGENTYVSDYEREHGDARSSWWPWSKPNRIVAQQGAAQIIEKARSLENGRIKRGLWAYDDADKATKEVMLMIDKAHGGDSISMYDLGVAYLRGLDGFPTNPEAAREWFRLSSARGFVPGMYNYAICLNEAVGGPGDANGAVRLFRIGAMRDDPLSQHNLGSSYGNGRGVARDYVEAAAWWILCESKVPQAKTNLANLVASSGPGFMAKAKARSEVLRNEITLNFFRLKKDLIW